MIGSKRPMRTARRRASVKRAWEATRQFVLAEAHWSFALRTVELTQRTDDSDWPIALGRKAFPLPADMVELVEIVEPCYLAEEDELYSIERGPNGQEILADDAGPITIRYVRDGSDIADPTSWPPSFVQAFAWRLAWQISDAMGAEKARKDRALQCFRQGAETRPPGQRADQAAPAQP
jgi:hypothetical protein